MGTSQLQQSNNLEKSNSSKAISSLTAPMSATTSRLVHSQCVENFQIQNNMFSVKPEKFLHDVGDAITLSSFTRRICSMNVYSLFFDYATVISKDTKDTSDICEQHADLNRYKDIRCLDQTRVKVQHATEPHDYINANYVDGFREERKFILTQSPMVNTVESFWTMIYQENVVEIVSMTSMHSSKTFMYMPIKRSDIATFGPYSIRYCGSQQIREAYEATILKLKKGNDQERKILHISFFTWHNKGTPEKPTEMLYLISDLNYNRKLLLEEAQKTGWLKDARSPILVHCLTGAGRSGTLAVLDICCRKMDYTEKTLNGNVLVDVRDTVLRVRTQRDKAVMKPEQYLLLHLLVIEYALRQKYFDDVDFMDLSNYNGTM